MSRSRRDQRGKRTNGEIAGRFGAVRFRPGTGNLAEHYDDRVGSPSAKRAAKRAVVRARRRADVEHGGDSVSVRDF